MTEKMFDSIFLFISIVGLISMYKAILKFFVLVNQYVGRSFRNNFT